ncbi:sigma-70 family RNA polymerase sigma factor [bacterium SCSIO 12741]|nr:sigma-70 family RNA polymerase sigma factor [bacterium SCSIO 12741]
MDRIRKEILDACIAGDRKAQLTLYKACYGPLLLICLRYKRDREEAAFLLNGAFYKVLKGLEKKDESVPFKAWAKRVTINYCIDDYHKNKTETELLPFDEELDFKSIAADPFEAAYTQAKHDKIREVLRFQMKKLPDKSQEVFQLYTMEGYSHAEIAELLNISEGTSKWHLNNARTKLKELLSMSLKNILPSVL